MTDQRTDRGRIAKKKKGLLRLRQDIPDSVFSAAGIVIPVVLFLLWWAVTAMELVRPLFLPSPWSVLEEGWRQLSEGILFADASVSIYRILIGWLAATVVAVPIGILMGNYKLIEGLLEPLISTVRYMPVVALIPLSILWAGIGDGQKILILFLGTFFQQALMIMDNVKNIDLNLIRAGQTLGFTNNELAPHYPACCPSGHMGHVPHNHRLDMDVSCGGGTGRGQCRTWPPYHGCAAVSFNGYNSFRNAFYRPAWPPDRLPVQKGRQVTL